MEYGLRSTLPARPALTPYIRLLFIDSHICLTLPSDLLLHANVGFASGYAVATAAVVTLRSAVPAFLIVDLAGWSWNALYGEVIGIGGLAFAVLTNAVFWAATIRYVHAIHPRLHLGGFLLGIAASLVIVVLYSRFFR